MQALSASACAFLAAYAALCDTYGIEFACGGVLVHLRPYHGAGSDPAAQPQLVRLIRKKEWPICP